MPESRLPLATQRSSARPIQLSRQELRDHLCSLGAPSRWQGRISGMPPSKTLRLRFSALNSLCPPSDARGWRASLPMNPQDASRIPVRPSQPTESKQFATMSEICSLSQRCVTKSRYHSQLCEPGTQRSSARRVQLSRQEFRDLCSLGAPSRRQGRISGRAPPSKTLRLRVSALKPLCPPSNARGRRASLPMNPQDASRIPARSSQPTQSKQFAAMSEICRLSQRCVTKSRSPLTICESTTQRSSARPIQLSRQELRDLCSLGAPSRWQGPISDRMSPSKTLRPRVSALKSLCPPSHARGWRGNLPMNPQDASRIPVRSSQPTESHQFAAMSANRSLPRRFVSKYRSPLTICESATQRSRARPIQLSRQELRDLRSLGAPSRRQGRISGRTPPSKTLRLRVSALNSLCPPTGARGWHASLPIDPQDASRIPARPSQPTESKPFAEKSRPLRRCVMNLDPRSHPPATEEPGTHGTNLFFRHTRHPSPRRALECGATDPVPLALTLTPQSSYTCQ